MTIFKSMQFCSFFRLVALSTGIKALYPTEVIDTLQECNKTASAGVLVKRTCKSSFELSSPIQWYACST